MSTAIVWFRRDLRLEDNPALAAAVAAHDHVLCAYVHAPQEEAPWAPGAASNAWLHRSLHALDIALKRRGAGLSLRQGMSLEQLNGLIRDCGATAIDVSRRSRLAVVEDLGSPPGEDKVSHIINQTKAFSEFEAIRASRPRPYVLLQHLPDDD